MRVHLDLHAPTRRQPHRHREYDDLFQEGCLGLMEAAARYDERRDGPFAPFAFLRIRRHVHQAIWRKFSLVGMPLDCPLKQKLATLVVGQDPATLDRRHATSIRCGAGESIRHCIHDRFLQAVEQAICDLAARPGTRRDPLPILRRIAREHLLVTGCVTPLRQIAREFGIASSRVCAYAERLKHHVREHLASDPEVATLVRIAGHRPDGLDSLLDAEAEAGLRSAAIHAFRRRYLELDRQRQASLLLALIDRAGLSASALASALKQLAAPREDLSVLCEQPEAPRRRPRRPAVS